YPTISLTNLYRSGTASGTTGVSPTGFDFFQSQASFNMTLYNFGKREGNVQAARETLDATREDYASTTQDIVLAIKQAYYTYLTAQAIVNVRKDTVRSRDLLVKQAQGFYEVGTRARIDVARAEANLYSAQADLIAAENAVKIAWVTLRNAMGSPRLPEQPVAEDSPEIQFSMNLAAARDVAFDASNGRRHVSDQTGLNTFPLQPTWSAQLSLNIPIFDGFRTTNRVEETLH